MHIQLPPIQLLSTPPLTKTLPPPSSLNPLHQLAPPRPLQRLIQQLLNLLLLVPLPRIPFRPDQEHNHERKGA